MDRRSAMKIIGLGSLTAMANTQASEARSQPEPSQPKIGPKSMAGRLLMPDFLSETKIPRYARGKKSRAIISLRGHKPVEINEGDVLLLPIFKIKDADEENTVVSILKASVQPANTVTCTGGELTRMGFNLVFEAMEGVFDAKKIEWDSPWDPHGGNSLIASNMLVNPSMLEKFKNLFKQGCDNDGRYDAMREAFKHGEAARITFYSFQYGPIQRWDEAKQALVGEGEVRNAPERTVSIIPCPSVHKDVILITAQPEYLGVYAFLPDGRVGMAVMNDRAVGQIKITDGC